MGVLPKGGLQLEYGMLDMCSSVCKACGQPHEAAMQWTWHVCGRLVLWGYDGEVRGLGNRDSGMLETFRVKVCCWNVSPGICSVGG